MPKRCEKSGCKKKLKLTDMSCVCGKTFCINHRLPESHCCSYDFTKDKIKIKGVTNEKLLKI